MSTTQSHVYEHVQYYVHVQVCSPLLCLRLISPKHIIIFNRLICVLIYFRDHISFINEMKVLIQSDELAKDVASAESLLERHQEHKVNILKI